MVTFEVTTEATGRSWTGKNPKGAGKGRQGGPAKGGKGATKAKQ